ncbi:MAG: dATP/dGTP pyrophosphohydrolase domain-containing protein [Bradyrhizobium sp.]|uniref:dATP/dGTP pyrophosphohydrolase domain-containing protein n=1 Tax=Bradyrhizobium sp. TaxID=376 RepID=UPI003BF0F1E7
MQAYDLVAHLLRQRAFSRATFGPGMRTKGVVDHIRKELTEIEGAPDDLTEWVDVVLLALDGLWRCAEHRANPVPIEVAIGAIVAKQDKNERRNWPDWRAADPDKAIEHVKIAGTLNGAPARPGCPYVGCPTPYLCRNGCKVSSSERVHLAEDVGGGP